MIGWLQRLIHDAAYALGHTDYMLGYQAGYGQGEFDGWMACVTRNEMRAERAEIMHGFDLGAVEAFGGEALTVADVERVWPSMTYYDDAVAMYLAEGGTL